MKFKKGNKVEVWRKSNEQMNSWFPGSITSIDGDRYIVQYEHFLNLEGEPVVEKVSQEDVRPQPPKAKEGEKWMDGDIAEVFDIHCWRIGKVVKVLKSSRFVVKLFGSIQLKEFHQSSLRVHQAWKNCKWIIIGKIVDGDNKQSIRVSPKHCTGIGGCGPEDVQGYNSRDKEGQERLRFVDCVRTFKRNYSCYCNDNPTELGNKKRKMTIKGRCCGLPQITLPFSQHVDGVLPAKSNISKGCKLNISSKGIQMEKSSKYSTKPFSMPTRITEDSDCCSVASCSSNDLPDYKCQTAWKSFKDVSDSSCDDAESLCPSASLGKFLSSEDGLKANVRELELRAYRRTLQALYASGPLSWEQESLLTNLRISLHISNEEHLLLLRQLLSAQEY